VGVIVTQQHVHGGEEVLDPIRRVHQDIPLCAEVCFLGIKEVAVGRADNDGNLLRGGSIMSNPNTILPAWGCSNHKSRITTSGWAVRMKGCASDPCVPRQHGIPSVGEGEREQLQDVRIVLDDHNAGTGR
jgi:hypothetical protein